MFNYIKKTLRNRRRKRLTKKQKRMRNPFMGLPLKRSEKDTDQMDPTHYDYAALANAAYQRTHDDKQNSVSKHLGTEHGYELLRPWSNKHTSVFRNPTTKEIVISYRGTKCSEGILECMGNDLMSDVAIAAGLERYDKRFSKSAKHFENVYNALRKENEEYKFVVTGHSLGGALSKYVFNEHEDKIHEAHAFNPGYSWKRMLRQDMSSDKYHNHFILGDPISMLGMLDAKNSHVYGREQPLAHFMKNFLDKN